MISIETASGRARPLGVYRCFLGYRQSHCCKFCTRCNSCALGLLESDAQGAALLVTP